MNIVILLGRLSSPPRQTELPSGTVRWNLELSCPVPDGRTLGVPVTWEGSVADGWDTDTVLVVTGMVRRRFFRAGGATQSRTEVEATAVVEVTRRRSPAQAVALATRRLGSDWDTLTGATSTSRRRPGWCRATRTPGAALAQASGRITRPVRSLGVKKVDFGGMSSPSCAVRRISSMLVGRINTPATTSPDVTRSTTWPTPCW